MNFSQPINPFLIIFFIIFYKFFLYKWLKFYQLNIIKKIKKDYKKNKARERYQNLSKKEKEKKQQYGLERYKNLSEDEKKMNWLSIDKNIMIMIIKKYLEKI